MPCVLDWVEAQSLLFLPWTKHFSPMYLNPLNLEVYIDQASLAEIDSNSSICDNSPLLIKLILPSIVGISSFTFNCLSAQGTVFSSIQIKVLFQNPFLENNIFVSGKSLVVAYNTTILLLDQV